MNLNQKYKIGIVDKERSFIDALESSLFQHYKLNFTYKNTESIQLNYLEHLQILIYNISQKGLQGPLIIEKIKKRNPKVKVIALCDYSSQIDYQFIYQINYSSVIHKSYALLEVFEILELVSSNNKSIFPKSFRIGDMQNKLPKLKKLVYEKAVYTRKEVEIVRLTASSLTNSQIANKLNISRRTVEGHKTRIMDKLNSRHPADLMKMAYKLRLVNYV